MEFSWLEEGLKAKGWEAAIVQPLADWLAGRPDLLECYTAGVDHLVVVKVAKLQWMAVLPLTRSFLQDAGMPAQNIVSFCHERLVRSWSVAVFTG